MRVPLAIPSTCLARTFTILLMMLRPPLRKATRIINYLEGTALAFALSLLLGERHLVQPVYLGQIPLVYYLGGLFGLIAMILTIKGMEKVPVAVSAIVVLAGQLLAGFVMDTLSGRVGLRELLGLCLVCAGVWWAGASKPQPEPEQPQPAETK